MAVTIASDLVMDVMRAADPARLRKVMTKLDGAAAGGVAGPSFASALAAAGSRPASPAGDAYGQFESFLLRDAFETMLPEADSGSFGAGYAGSMWRSMAAEQYASIFTVHGGLGIAEMLRQRGSTAEPPAPAQGQWPYFPPAATTAFANPVQG